MGKSFRGGRRRRLEQRLQAPRSAGLWKVEQKTIAAGPRAHNLPLALARTCQLYGGRPRAKRVGSREAGHWINTWRAPTLSRRHFDIPNMSVSIKIEVLI